MNDFYPVAEAALLDTLMQPGKRGVVYVDADNLFPAETSKFHGLLPLAAADVKNTRLFERREQPVSPPGMLPTPPAQFLYVQCLIDVHQQLQLYPVRPPTVSSNQIG